MPFDATPKPQPKGKKLRYGIDLACNDPDNGNFLGEVHAVDICSGALECDGRIFARPLKLVVLDDAIRLSGKRWPVKDSRDWIGNWCWNYYAMLPVTVVAFAMWLKKRNLFSGWEGSCDLVDWMEGKREMSPFELRAQFDAWLMTE